MRCAPCFQGIIPARDYFPLAFANGQGLLHRSRYHAAVVAPVSFIGQKTERGSRAPVGLEGDCQVMRKLHHIGLLIVFVCLATGVARAQSFRVQCPTSTITHPVAANNDSEPAYAGPTYSGTTGYPAAPARVNGAIKCQQISGGDGFSTMG